MPNRMKPWSVILLTGCLVACLDHMTPEANAQQGKPAPATASFSLPTPRLEEIPGAFLLVIPLNAAEDAKNITVNVSDRLIQVSGKFDIMAPDGKQVLGTSSFMRSFTPRVAVDPAKVERHLKGKTLEVSIAKKPHSSPRYPDEFMPLPAPQTPAPKKNPQLEHVPQIFI